jgi:hypothetical protein
MYKGQRYEHVVRNYIFSKNLFLFITVNWKMKEGEMSRAELRKPPVSCCSYFCSSKLGYYYYYYYY